MDGWNWNLLQMEVPEEVRRKSKLPLFHVEQGMRINQPRILRPRVHLILEVLTSLLVRLSPIQLSKGSGFGSQIPCRGFKPSFGNACTRVLGLEIVYKLGGYKLIIFAPTITIALSPSYIPFGTAMCSREYGTSQASVTRTQISFRPTSRIGL